jgi:23S rRNA pseudoU1915 N3-methylase RlmH
MSVDDNIELMVDDKTVEFVNRVNKESKLEISNYVQNMSISNNESGRKELTKEEKRLRNKCFRDSMKAKIRREKEECKKVG